MCQKRGKASKAVVAYREMQTRGSPMVPRESNEMIIACLCSHVRVMHGYKSSFQLSTQRVDTIFSNCFKSHSRIPLQ